MCLKVMLDREEDGRWIAEVADSSRASSCMGRLRMMRSPKLRHYVSAF